MKSEDVTQRILEVHIKKNASTKFDEYLKKHDVLNKFMDKMF